jgi:hypothetical protein
MRIYYQISAGFALSDGKASLTSMSFNSTFEYSPFTIISSGSPLAISRFFRSIPQAQSYIDYLFSRYPQGAVIYPVLDPLQLILL